MQLRKDPVTSRWIIVNAEDPKKPGDYHVEPRERSSKACPFCPGNEAMTPPEITAYGRKGGAPNGAGWKLRVIPNKFPALRIEESTDKIGKGVYDKLGGFGAHEILIETPDHQKEIADMSLEEAELLVRAYRDRCVDLKKDPRFQYILIFKNYGAAAGASLEHPHSQLIALPIVPSRVKGEVKGAHKHYEYTDRCVFCDMLHQEKSDQKLTVSEDGGFAVITPFASRFPFETWILPTAHESAFEELDDDGVRSLALALKTTLAKMRSVLGDPSYNFMIHSSPLHTKDTESYHWHIEIIPQLTQVSGFELGTGFYINPTPPEACAAALRAASPA